MIPAHRLPRSARMLLAAIFAAVIVFFASAGPAAAERPDRAPSDSGGYGVCNAQQAVDSSALPVTRWAGGTDKFHSRLGTNAWNDVAEKLQRQGVITVMYAIGNTAWATTTGLIETAVNFCVLDKVGGAVDQAAHKIGKALMASGLVAAFVVASLILYIWRIGRGGGAGNSSLIFQKGLIVGLFGVMLAGSAASSGGGANGDDGPYRPGVGSPGYFAVTIDNIVSASANSITSNFQNNDTLQGAETGWGDPKKNGNDNLGCAPYVQAMKDVYKDRYVEYAGGEKYYAASASVPLMLSTMWENTGLRMWIRAQFGEQNNYGDYMYCRLLEYNAGAPRTPGEEAESGKAGNDASIQSLLTRAGVIKRGSGNDVKMGGKEFDIDVSSENLAFRYSGSNKWRDRAWVGWAACAHPGVSGSGNDPGRMLVHTNGGASDGQLAEKCQEFFTKSDWNGGGGQGEFDWDDSNDDISGTDTSNAAQDFLLTLHGNKNGAGLISGLVYMISSIMIAVVFSTIALAVLVAKCAALLMMLMMFFTLLVALLPNMTASKIFDYAKQYTGLSLFAWGTQLILSVLAFITTILISVGGTVVPEGPGGIMSLMWTGFAPVIAVFCLHMMFKKMRVPSPMKVSAGMAWGKMAAAGAVGAGAVTGGTMLGNRLSNRVKAGAWNKSKNAASGLTGKGRRSRMAPGGSGGFGAPSATGPEGVPTDNSVESLAARAAKREEIKDVKGDDDYKDALAKVKAERKGGARDHVKERLSAVGQQFREKPVSTLAKAGAIGAVGAVTLGAAGIPLALAGAAAAKGVGINGVRKTAQAANPLDRSRSNADRIEAHSRMMASRRAAEAKNKEDTKGYLSSARGAPAQVVAQQAAARAEQQKSWGNTATDYASLGKAEPQSNGQTVTAIKPMGAPSPAQARQ